MAHNNFHSPRRYPFEVRLYPVDTRFGRSHKLSVHTTEELGRKALAKARGGDAFPLPSRGDTIKLIKRIGMETIEEIKID